MKEKKRKPCKLKTWGLWQDTDTHSLASCEGSLMFLMFLLRLSALCLFQEDLVKKIQGLVGRIDSNHQLQDWRCGDEASCGVAPDIAHSKFLTNYSDTSSHSMSHNTITQVTSSFFGIQNFRSKQTSACACQGYRHHWMDAHWTDARATDVYSGPNTSTRPGTKLLPRLRLELCLSISAS